MGLIDSLLDSLAQRLGKRIQGTTLNHARRDVEEKGRTFSVEAQVSESLADLMLMDFTLPISGTSERAKWLDACADDFVLTTAKKGVSLAFELGDAVIVPLWNGKTFDNVVVGADDFEILSACGDRIESMVYVVDEKKMDNGETYKLLQYVSLEDYAATDGTTATACRYQLFVAKNDSLTDMPADKFPEWADYESDWSVPNVDRLLVGRYKSFSVDPHAPNTTKGVPICFGASQHIREIHYLLDQMHDEFHLSEKFVMADKSLFQRKTVRGRDGEEKRVTVLPDGKERVVMATSGTRSVDGSPMIHDWSPDIRYTAYLETLDKQCQLVEKAVGVSSGIISNMNDMNYQNVDNVRKSQQKTMAFIKTARRVAESCFEDLVYAWDVLSNFYGIVPVGTYEVAYDWSDDYVNTFADQQNAILAGESIGATDAIDYRMFVMGESPEEARENVERIKAAKGSQSLTIEDALGIGKSATE